jgi:hypothetical protein
MTPDQQRIKIAEACGWTCVGINPEIGVATARRELGNLWGIPPGRVDVDEVCSWAYRVPPDYPNDLNAMREALKALPDRNKYYEVLATVCGYKPERGEERNEFLYYILEASAAQCAEAFLRTIGKWKEIEP